MCNTKEDYDEERAVAHVRRVLDIVACTTSFGPSAATKDGSKSDTGKNEPDSKGAKKTAAKNDKDKQSPPEPAPQSKNSKSPASNDVAVDGDGEMSHSCPKLGSFYEFFSLAHLTPPLQCILLSLRIFFKTYFKHLYVFVINDGGCVLNVCSYKKGRKTTGRRSFR